MYKKIHFVGIGGIGMSALARYYMSSGAVVSGSDGVDSEIVQSLISEGAKVMIGHSEENVPDDTDLMIYTVAIPSDNPELLKGIKLNNEDKCKVLTYAQALGEMSKEKMVISVAGTHGKTTTTAMVFYALREAGLDVSMVLGSLIDYTDKNGVVRKTNYVHGESEWIVIEACEYKRSFMNYDPQIILLTNIDADHLDYYKDLEDIKNSFQDFVNKLESKDGKLICHTQEYDSLRSKNKINADEKTNIEEVDLSVPGEHNRKNAQLVIALGQVLALDDLKIKEGLKKFTGTWRRQEYKGTHFEMECYDDYAHHPSEVKATLQAFREKYPDKKIIAAFMPHLYSRTKLLFDEFTNAFQDADQVILLPIYAAREPFDSSISSDMLARELNNYNKEAVALGSIEALKDYLSIHGDKDSVLITMGAGDIYKVYE